MLIVTKHLEVKISQYSYHTYGIIIIFFHYYSLYVERKNGHFAGIMLDAPTMALSPKLCRHNVSNPTGRSGSLQRPL